MIKLGICGYGNLGKGVIDNLKNFSDFELKAIFSRRKLTDVEYPVYSIDEIKKLEGKLDVVILCGGSATDLPNQTPYFAQSFNVVDSFDTHAKIPQHFENVDKSAKKGGNLALISAGWDPGLFSITRATFNAFLPCGADVTFWGKGVSQGHSDAIRRINGVKRAVQYTIPKQQALEQARSGNVNLTTREKHLRECFVVLDDDADKQQIENSIKTMPNYFAEYDTVVHFISEDEFYKNHLGMPHGGRVLRSGKSTPNVSQSLELSIDLQSNPHFTSGILLAYARAVVRLKAKGETGCITPFDVSPTMLYSGTAEEMRKNLL